MVKRSEKIKCNDNDSIESDVNESVSEDHAWQDYHNGVDIAFHPTDDRNDDNNFQYLFFCQHHHSQYSSY